ncbi:MAG: hypothetical protein J7K73_01350 [Nanoarchaeota archaeon]|nr:hypothetical protein [Nanoarchaeota archaeon]
MLRLATPEDDKRLEEELLKLNEKDKKIYEIAQKINGPITPEDVLKNNCNIFSKKDIESSLYKLHRNGKLRLEYNNGWYYARWN